MGKDKKAKGKAEEDKKNTSLRLKGKTLKALKLRAIEQETSVQQILETLVEDYLRLPRPPAEETPEPAADGAAE